MLKKLIVLSLGILPLILKAQINISAQLPPAGMVQKEQLWNLILINNREDILDVSIKFSLQDAVSGQVVMSAQSGNILLGKGVKTISSKDVQPVLYNYNNQDFSGNYLPLGAYVACYQLNLNGLKEASLAQECIQINIEPLSPPLLNSPADQSEINTPYPQFTWMPPAPFDMFSNLNYDLIVTEVLQNQALSDAIQNNIPVYSRTNIPQPSENYSTSFGALQPDKLYAWQVVARNGFSYAVKTEVWTFSIGKEGERLSNNNDTYILLEDAVNGIYHVKKDMLHIKYYSFSKEFTSIVTFTNEKGDIVKKVSQKIVPGNNYLDFNLRKNFQTGRSYKVSITDMNKKAHVLTFSIK